MAVHEAGHVAVHLAVGLPFLRATVVPTVEYLGCVVPDPEAPVASNELYAILAVAGTVAVDHWLGRRWNTRHDGHQDWSIAMAHLSFGLCPMPAVPPDEKRRSTEAIRGLPIHLVATLWNLQVCREYPGSGSRLQSRLGQVARIAEQFLSRPRVWPRVLRLADLLMERKTLTYADASAAWNAQA